MSNSRAKAGGGPQQGMTTQEQTLSPPAGEPYRPISRGSNFTTEYDEAASATAFQPAAPALATPSKSHKMALIGDQSRPGTANTVNSRGNWSAYQRSMPNYAGSTGGASIRPESAGSRSHVSTLTAHAFHRPMSSQRLQAQRSVRSAGHSAGPPSLHRGNADGTDDDKSNVESRPHTGRKSAGPSRPISRSTDVTDLEPTMEEDVPEVPRIPNLADLPGSLVSNATQGGAAAFAAGQERSHSDRPANLDVERANDSTIAPAQITPRSFRSSILKTSRHSRTSFNGRSGHEKLPSDASTMQAREATKQYVKKNLGKNYEYFPGNTVFCLGGRLQNTRGRPVNIGTAIIFVVPVALFFPYSGVWYWRHVSPAVPIVFAYIFLVCFSSFWHASVTDPGVLPRNLHSLPPAEPDEDPLTLGPPTVSWTLIKSANKAVDAMEVPSKFCKTCDIWRPPRTHHCRTCDNCIETQDHHCVWLNNCVGRRNYRYFFTFVSSGVVLALFLIGASLAHVLLVSSRDGISFSAAANANRVPMALFAYGILAGLYPLALVAYHLWLIARGETTREYIQSQKFAPADRHRPYTQGSVFKNWIAVLNRPRPPTYLRFKSARVVGDPRFGETKRVKGEKTSKDVEMVDVGANSTRG